LYGARFGTPVSKVTVNFGDYKVEKGGSKNRKLLWLFIAIPGTAGDHVEYYPRLAITVESLQSESNIVSLYEIERL
jgi:hypothetical protein